MQQNFLLAQAKNAFEGLDTKIFMLVILALIALLFIGVGWMLAFHWKNYTFETPTIRKVKKLFFGVSSGLFFMAIISLIVF